MSLQQRAQGVASVTVSDSGGVLASAVFAANQIVVSVDHLNTGVGFGVVPGGIGASGFDVTQLQPLYPAAVGGNPYYSGVGTVSCCWTGYDLTLAYARNNASPGSPFHADGSTDIFSFVYSCNQFSGSANNGTCGSPVPVQTNQGAFTIDKIFPSDALRAGQPVYIGEFTATSDTPEPSALSLLGTGLLGSIGIIRRKLVR